MKYLLERPLAYCAKELGFDSSNIQIQIVLSCISMDNEHWIILATPSLWKIKPALAAWGYRFSICTVTLMDVHTLRVPSQVGPWRDGYCSRGANGTISYQRSVATLQGAWGPSFPPSSAHLSRECGFKPQHREKVFRHKKIRFIERKKQKICRIFCIKSKRHRLVLKTNWMAFHSLLT